MNLHDVKRLKVLGKDYEVVWYGEHPVPGETLTLQGKQDWTSGKIYIRKRLDAERTLDTLLHEVFHAIAAELSMEVEERDIICFSSGLQCFLRDTFYLELRGRVKNDNQNRMD